MVERFMGRRLKYEEMVCEMTKPIQIEKPVNSSISKMNFMGQAASVYGNLRHKDVPEKHGRLTISF
jgi:hypothetical protein